MLASSMKIRKQYLDLEILLRIRVKDTHKIPTSSCERQQDKMTTN